MIRFNCPTCDRPYALADAYAGLPLLCKGCGQRITPPPPQPDPEPPPVVPPPPPPALPLAEEIADQPVLASGRREPPVLANPERERGGDPNPGRDREGDPTPSLALGVRHETGGPVPPPAAAKPAGGRRLVAGLADGAVTLLLMAAGAVVGEEVAGRPTPAILEEAGSAAFPPDDLIVWAGCVLFFPLVYGLLGARGWTVGGWLKRRAA